MCLFASLILSACDRKLTVGAIYQCTAHMCVSLLGNIRSVSFMCRGSHWLSPCFYLFIYLFVFVHLWHDVNYCPVQWIWQWDRMEIVMERGSGRGNGNGNSLWSGKVRRLCWRVCLPAVNSGKTAKKAARQKQNSNNNTQRRLQQQQPQQQQRHLAHTRRTRWENSGFFFEFFRIFDFVSHLFSLRIENLCKYFLVYWLFHPFCGMEVCQLSWDPA